MPLLPRPLRRIIGIAAMALTAGAVVQQLRRPASDRTWTGTILGVPYDFRRPTLTRFRERWWNPNDQRLFTPHAFGVGWSVNLYRLMHRGS